MEGRTTLLVAHRRSTLRLADRIGVVEAGRVVDQGTHAELMARCAAYRLLLSGPGEDAEGVGALAVDEDEATSTESRRRCGRTTGRGLVLRAGDDGVPDVLAGCPRRAGGLTSGRTGRPRRRPGPSGAAGPGGGEAAGSGRWRPLRSCWREWRLSRPSATRPTSTWPAKPGTTRRFRCAAFIRPFRRPLAVGFVLVVLDALATLAGPLLDQHGLDKGVANHSEQALFAASAICSSP